MSWLSSIIKKAAPIVATVSPDPVTKGIATGLSIQYANQEAKYQQKLAEEKLRERKIMPASYPSGFDPVTGNIIQQPTTTQNAGMGGFLVVLLIFLKGQGK